MKFSKKIIVIIVLIFFIGISSTIAYLVSKSSKINEFEIGNVDAKVNETFNKEEKTKKDVYITNTGNIDEYVRVKINIYYKNNDDVIIYEDPIINEDYTIDLNLNDWFLSDDGYYYYKYKIGENKSTSNIINSLIYLKNYEDKSLTADVIVNVIQSNDKALEEAWNKHIENGLLKEE